MQKKFRLRKRQEFKRIYSKGKSVANRELVLYALDNPNNNTFRIGISVSKKIGNAVIRNRVKRLIKEALRPLQLNIKNNRDFIIIARKPTAEMKFVQFDKSIKDLLRKGNFLEKNS